MTAIETGTQDLLVRVEDGVAVLTINRPERRNALSPVMLEALATALREAEENDDVGCVVLTGAGGAFCAGGDVKAMAERQGDGMDYDALVARQRRSHRATAGRLHAMPKPTIAALPGPAAGAGLSLALACDLRIAARGAILSTAFALVGPARARELYFLSERLSAEEAQQLGIVNRVVDADRLEEETLRLAARLASGPRIALRYMKENLNRAENGDGLGECMDLEATHHLRTMLTEDHREAAAAFTEKRQPTFVGK